MKSLAEQDHYEILEVSRSAPLTEIERAYRVLQSTYASDSLALYSLFDEADSAALKERIDIAYGVLSNAADRHAYDEEIDAWGVEQDSQLGEFSDLEGHAELGSLRASEPSPAAESAAPEADVTQPPAPEIVEPDAGEVPPGIEGFQDLEGDAEEGEDYDGARLRRARLRRGIELDQISSVTKVSVAFLRGIEMEAYGDLPAPVYVRGFVTAYARAIGLESKGVVTSYMARLEASKQSRPRSRLLGLR